MFIHLEMRKTMSQEPFDFSSTAESDFAPSHAYVSKKTKIEDVTSTAVSYTHLDVYKRQMTNSVSVSVI